MHSGGRIRLSADGTSSARATGVAGSVRAHRVAGVTGIRPGAKPGTSLDQFRMYRGTLTDAQLAELRPANGPFPGRLRPTR